MTGRGLVPRLFGRRGAAGAIVVALAICALSASGGAAGAGDAIVRSLAAAQDTTGAVRARVAPSRGDTSVAGHADTSSTSRSGASSTGSIDTSSVIRPDTAASAERTAPWTMDELKAVLGRETQVFGAEKEYRQRKSGRVAMACALVFPGLGQAYNEKPLKAAIAAGAQWFYVNQIILNRRLREREKDIRDAYPVSSFQWSLHDQMVEEYWERSVDWIWWTGAAMIVIIVDAYVDAHLDDMRFKVEVGGKEDGAAIGLVFRY